MRKLFVSEYISIDGFFEGPNKELDWFTENEDFNNDAEETFHSVDTILLGRTTYELFADYWPAKTINDDPVSAHMNDIPKIVISNTLKGAPWGKHKPASILNGDVETKILALKQKPGKDIVIFGSGSIVSQLTKFKLIDEYRFIISPAVLGSGNTLFMGINERTNFNLVETKQLGSGIVVRYKVNR